MSEPSSVHNELFEVSELSCGIPSLIFCNFRLEKRYQRQQEHDINRSRRFEWIVKALSCHSNAVDIIFLLIEDYDLGSASPVISDINATRASISWKGGFFSLPFHYYFLALLLFWNLEYSNYKMGIHILEHAHARQSVNFLA